MTAEQLETYVTAGDTLLWKWITFKMLLLGWVSFVDTCVSVHSATGGHVYVLFLLGYNSRKTDV